MMSFIALHAQGIKNRSTIEQELLPPGAGTGPPEVTLRDPGPPKRPGGDQAPVVPPEPTPAQTCLELRPDHRVCQRVEQTKPRRVAQLGIVIRSYQRATVGISLLDRRIHQILLAAQPTTSDCRKNAPLQLLIILSNKACCGRISWWRMVTANRLAVPTADGVAAPGTAGFGSSISVNESAPCLYGYVQLSRGRGWAEPQAALSWVPLPLATPSISSIWAAMY